MKKNSLWIFIFAAPTMLLYIMIFGAPLIMVFATSFCEYTGFIKPRFIGLENYLNLLFRDTNFRAAFVNTCVWILLQVFVHVSFGTIVALVLSRKPFGWKFVRTSFMMTNIIPTAAIGMMYIIMCNPEIGLINAIIHSVGFKDFNPNWFGDSAYAFYSATATWLLYAPFITIFIMSEIGTISPSVFESARVDGASNFKIDLYITLPMLKNIISTCVILAVSSMITEFDVIYMTTKGGPGTTTLNLPMYLYKTANLEMNYGMSNTIGVFQILFGITLVLLVGKIFSLGKSNT